MCWKFLISIKARTIYHITAVVQAEKFLRVMKGEQRSISQQINKAVAETEFNNIDYYSMWKIEYRITYSLLNVEKGDYQLWQFLGTPQVQNRCWR